jgi:hypothetical protein
MYSTNINFPCPTISNPNKPRNLQMNAIIFSLICIYYFSLYNNSIFNEVRDIQNKAILTAKNYTSAISDFSKEQQHTEIENTKDTVMSTQESPNDPLQLEITAL